MLWQIDDQVSAPSAAKGEMEQGTNQKLARPSQDPWSIYWGHGKPQATSREEWWTSTGTQRPHSGLCQRDGIVSEPTHCPRQVASCLGYCFVLASPALQWFGCWFHTSLCWYLYPVYWGTTSRRTTLAWFLNWPTLGTPRPPWFTRQSWLQSWRLKFHLRNYPNGKFPKQRCQKCSQPTKPRVFFPKLCCFARKNLQKMQATLALHEAMKANQVSHSQVAFAKNPPGLFTLEAIKRAKGLKLIPMGNLVKPKGDVPKGAITMQHGGIIWQIQPWKQFHDWEKQPQPQECLVPFWWCKAAEEDYNMELTTISLQAMGMPFKIPCLTNMDKIEANQLLTFQKPEADEEPAEEEGSQPSQPAKKKRKTWQEPEGFPFKGQKAAQIAGEEKTSSSCWIFSLHGNANHEVQPSMIHWPAKGFAIIYSPVAVLANQCSCHLMALQQSLHFYHHMVPHSGHAQLFISQLAQHELHQRAKKARMAPSPLQGSNQVQPSPPSQFLWGVPRTRIFSTPMEQWLETMVACTKKPKGDPKIFVWYPLDVWGMVVQVPEGPTSSTSTADGSMRMAKSGGNGMTRTWGTQWSGGKDISFKPKYDALPPGRMHLDQMSDMLLYSRPYRSWTPWTDVWFCHCILAALLTIVLPLSSPTCLVLAGGNDIPPGFPQEEQYFELENGEQRPWKTRGFSQQGPAPAQKVCVLLRSWATTLCLQFIQKTCSYLNQNFKTYVSKTII